MPQTTQSRAIIHVDMDAFYAAVEQLDHPEYRQQPVIVGGLGRRGVVATASYEARRFGVHSALPMAKARRLCPKAVFVRPRMHRYQQLSREIFAVFAQFTPQIQGLSLDEAFLDVSASLTLFGSITELGGQLRRSILEQTGLIASIGMAHNKFLAKLASDTCKPNGALHIAKDQVRQFLDPMPVGRLWGIGQSTQRKLAAVGIITVGQLRITEQAHLRAVLGNRSEHFQRLASGIDEREVEHAVEDKSISHEVTFDVNIDDDRELRAELLRQTEAVAQRLRKSGYCARTVTIKLRDHRFKTSTRSMTLRAYSKHTATLYQVARSLLQQWRASRKHTPIRLLGMGVSNLELDQAVADISDSSAAQSLDHTLDRIREKYGNHKATRGLAIEKPSDDD